MISPRVRGSSSVSFWSMDYKSLEMGARETHEAHLNNWCSDKRVSPKPIQSFSVFSHIHTIQMINAIPTPILPRGIFIFPPIARIVLGKTVIFLSISYPSWRSRKIYPARSSEKRNRWFPSIQVVSPRLILSDAVYVLGWEQNNPPPIEFFLTGALSLHLDPKIHTVDLNVFKSWGNEK